MERQTTRDIYELTDYLNWDVSRGDKTVHAHRMPGRFRNRKWLTMALVSGPFFLIPYFNWDDRQAIYFDIPARKFYLFGGVIWPQDLWMLALLLLFCFVCLFAMTAISGRIFCGFVCPQAAWTDLMTLAERWVEGKPSQRIKLDAMPWNAEKIRKKTMKHTLWIAICTLTSVTFLGYFSGIFDAWGGLFALNYNIYEWVSFTVIFALFYVNTGFVREQVCNWVCPYARIQGVMTDKDTLTTTYDLRRGEPRGKLGQGGIAAGHGDCIDCKMCVSVCPTGVDIRKGQQLGCINCGLCIDACDTIMEKVGRPRGLIRFMSHNEMETGERARHPLLRPRPIIYLAATIMAFTGIIGGMLLKSPVDLNVRHERSPVFTTMSDGSIHNAYHMILLNKTESAADFTLTTSGIPGAYTNADDKVFHLKSGEVKHFDMHVRSPRKGLQEERQELIFDLRSVANPDEVFVIYKSMFFGPKL